MKSIILILCVTALLATGCCLGHGPEKKQGDDLPYKTAEFTPDCRWGATPDNVMNVMFEMAELRQSDVLFDLGCGDGRVVVEAVKRYGLAGVGIDIDPEKIIESRKRAAKAGVERKTYFANMDLFETDFSRATVLALFLSTDVLIKLRPRLLEQLKPGTRIVLHTHSMGAWDPDRFQKIDIACFDPGKTGCFRTVKLFIVPANVTGTWRWETGVSTVRLDMKQKFQTVSGTLMKSGQPVTMERIRLSGDTIRFTAVSRERGSVIKTNYSGSITGNTISGTITTGKSGGPVNTWLARRDPGTIETIAR